MRVLCWRESLRPRPPLPPQSVRGNLWGFVVVKPQGTVDVFYTFTSQTVTTHLGKPFDHSGTRWIDLTRLRLERVIAGKRPSFPFTPSVVFRHNLGGHL